MNYKNENTKICVNLLKQVEIPQFKFRYQGKKIDLFFPSKDLFIYLNKQESFIFNVLFIKKLNLAKVVALTKIKFKLNEKKAVSKITNFIKKFSEAIK